MTYGTIRGTLDLDAGGVVRSLADFERGVRSATAQEAGMGRAFDRSEAREAQAAVGSVGRSTSELGSNTARARVEVRAGWQAARRDMARDAARVSSGVVALRERLRALGRGRATASVSVGGAARAAERTVVLRSRLPFVPAAGGGGVEGRGGGGVFVAGDHFGVAGIGGRGVLAGAAFALPAGQALFGGGGALAGSATAGALGAGAVGLSGASVVMAGVGSVVAVAKPAQVQLEAVLKADERLSLAVREFGARSREAVAAREDLDAAARAAPGALPVARGLRAFEREWSGLTAPGRRAYYGLLADGIGIGRRVAPTVARDANLASRQVRRQGLAFAGFLAGSETQETAGVLTRTFVRELRTVEQGLEDVTLATERLARASIPFMHEAAGWAEAQTAGWERSTRDLDATRDSIGGLVDDTRAWMRLAGAGWRLVRDVGVAADPSGRSLVSDMTTTLDRWDVWLDAHPQETQQFFERTAGSVEEMAGAGVQVVGFLNRLATVAQPVFDRAVQLAGLAAQLGPIASAAGGALIFGFTRALRSGETAFADTGVAPALLAAGGTPRGDVLKATGARAGWTAWRARQARTVESAGARAFNRIYGGVEGARYGAPVRAGATAAAEAGGAARLGMAARAGGKAFWPVAALFGVLDFASYKGNVGDRTMAALSSATLGIVERPKTDAELALSGQEQAQQFLVQRVGGVPQTIAQARRALTLTDAEIARSTARLRGPERTAILGDSDVFGVNVGGLGSGQASGTTDDERRELRARIATLHAERDALADLGDELHREHELRLDRQSARRGREWAGELPETYRVLTRGGQSPAQAAEMVAGLVRDRLGRTRDGGVEALSEATLSWARTLDAGAPGVQEVIDDLTGDIRGRFKAMGRRMRIVGASILTGTRSEWRRLSAALTGPVEHARQALDEDLTTVQRQAIGSLEAMGFSAGQARGLLANAERGSRAAQRTLHDPQGAARSGRLGGRTGPSAIDTASAPRRAMGGKLPYAVMGPTWTGPSAGADQVAVHAPVLRSRPRRAGRWASAPARRASWRPLAPSVGLSRPASPSSLVGTMARRPASMTGPAVRPVAPALRHGTLAALRTPRLDAVKLPGTPRRPKRADATPASGPAPKMRPPRLRIDPAVLPAPVLGLLRPVVDPQDAPDSGSRGAPDGASIGRVAVTVAFEDDAERQRRFDAEVARIAAERLLVSVRSGGPGIIE